MNEPITAHEKGLCARLRCDNSACEYEWIQGPEGDEERTTIPACPKCGHSRCVVLRVWWFEQAIHSARECLARLRIARERSAEAFAALRRLAEELSMMDPPEAWARPLPPESPDDDDQRTFYLNFRAFGPNDRGTSYAPGHKWAPERGARDQWHLSLGQAVHGEHRTDPRRNHPEDGDPVNLEIGKRCEEAWFANDAAAVELRERTKEYEALIRSIVEAP